RRQVADMAVRRQYCVAWAKVAVDGLGLGGALDDDDSVHAGRKLGTLGLRGRRKVGALPRLCQRADRAQAGPANGSPEGGGPTGAASYRWAGSGPRTLFPLTRLWRGRPAGARP